MSHRHVATGALWGVAAFAFVCGCDEGRSGSSPKPEITAFTIDSADPSTSATVPITFTATDPQDDIAAYLVREDDDTAPTEADFAGAPATAPATYTVTGGDGQHTLYAWVIDAEGNISAAGSSATITIDTTGSISGTVYYSGAESGTHELIVFVATDFGQDPAAFGQYAVSDTQLAAGYAFSLTDIPEGTYILAIWWDVIAGGGGEGDPGYLDLSIQIVSGQDTALGDCTLGPKGHITVSVDGGPDDTVVGSMQLASYYNSEQPPFPADSMAVMAGEMGGAPLAMITFGGAAAGGYDVAAGNAAVMYADAGGNMYVAQPALGSGTVTATAVGAVGELVEGTFDVVAYVFDPDTGNPTGATVNLTGTFSVERAEDDFALGGP